MLWSSRKIHGYAIEAEDGALGKIADFLFEDTNWSIRWLVVDTRHWLTNRKILLPTLALGHLDTEKREFFVRLTKKQVEDSPKIDTDLPVSRQMETNIFDTYGWSPYWGNGYMSSGFGAMLAPAMVPPTLAEHAFRDTENRDGDSHLRSVGEITNYDIRADDGEIGHVSDLLISDTDWSIRYLVVDIGTWWAGKKSLIPPNWVQRVDWIAAEIRLNVDRAALRDRPDYTSETVVDAAYERRIHQDSINPGSETPYPRCVNPDLSERL
jgi:hypothetical protein